ncbi:MAG TPA: tetratricopeptide repeat protein [Lentimicrobium sp.]|nr:tetratricopeptide repeat protein [Lentimicrobium sp.]
MGRALIAFIILIALGISNSNAQDKTALTKVFSESYSYESKAEYAKAIEVIKKVYSTDSYEMNLRLGWLNYEAKNYKESLVYYNRAIQLLPLSIEAKLGYAYPAYALGQKEAVIVKYKEILETDPNNYYGNYRIGSLYFEMKDYSNARKHFDKLINFYPFDYDIIIMSAWTYYYLNKPREAKVLFNKALLNRPSDKSATEGLSLIK